MDKGVKGLLTGDLSVALLVEIQRSIEKYQRQFVRLSNKINDMVQKQTTLDELVAKHFTIDVGFDRNLPTYATVAANFQDMMVSLDNKDWRAQVQLKEEANYFARTN